MFKPITVSQHLSYKSCKLPNFFPVGKKYSQRINRLVLQCSQEAEQQIKQGLKQYKSGNKMGALDSFEKSLNMNPSKEQSQAALYNATCVHANFGDVELAQVSLREAMVAGLDFELAVAAPQELMLQISAPTQILLQLKRFSQSIKQKRTQRSKEIQASSVGKAQNTPEFSFSGNVDELFSTEVRDMDTSVFGIVRRVLLLVFALTAFGIALFYFGLQYMFPY
eukprot:TRINITY_DN6802_c0_g1_i2.p3 TRINITY_DN6802_c0_g1~~TRINITY_DN6802_c0_g1_i2.p3  ORF type:complete len:223 (-),score=14.13 TRINITY_DN6802_c0_g1_i2:326-994(-)